MRTSAPSRHVSDADLVVVDDHDLEASRRARIEAHLAACPGCRERLAASCVVGELLRRRYPAVQDPGSWEALSGRLAEAGRRPTPRPRAALATAPLLLLLLLLVTALQVLQASRGNNEPAPLLHVATSNPVVATLTFAAVEPPRLPLGLVGAERSTPASDRLELLYRNEAGLAVLLAQSPTGGAPAPTTTASELGQGTVEVDGTAVLVLNDPWPSSVAGMFWDRGGVRFELDVTEAPPGGCAGTTRRGSWKRWQRHKTQCGEGGSNGPDGGSTDGRGLGGGVDRHGGGRPVGGGDGAGAVFVASDAGSAVQRRQQEGALVRAQPRPDRLPGHPLRVAYCGQLLTLVVVPENLWENKWHSGRGSQPHRVANCRPPSTVLASDATEADGRGGAGSG